jgi:hypothetical protein
VGSFELESGAHDESEALRLGVQRLGTNSKAGALTLNLLDLLDRSFDLHERFSQRRTQGN